MTALAAPRDVSGLGDFVDPVKLNIPVKAAAKIYPGAIVSIRSGYAVQGAATAGDLPLGVCEDSAVVDNTSGSNGDLKVNVRQGVFPMNSGTSADAITQANMGADCYVIDDQTVGLTDSLGTRPRAGKIMGIDENSKVLVLFNLGDQGTEAVSIPFGVVTIPVPALADVANSGVLARFTPGFAGRIKASAFQVTTPVTTAAKAATLTPKIAGTSVTGGTVALTSANCTPAGANVAGAAITAANSFTAAQEITVVASSVTTFVEGAGVIVLTLG